MGLVGDDYSFQSVGGKFEASDTKGFPCAKQLYKNIAAWPRRSLV